MNCRVLPEDTEQYVLEHAEEVVADDQVLSTPMGARTKGPASEMRPDVMQAVSSVTDRLWPGVPAVPIMVMGATDGAYLRAAGIPTYGVQGFFMDRDDIRFHGRDERMGVQAFYEGQAFLYEVVKRLASSASPPSATAR